MEVDDFGRPQQVDNGTKDDNRDQYSYRALCAVGCPHQHHVADAKQDAGNDLERSHRFSKTFKGRLESPVVIAKAKGVVGCKHQDNRKKKTLQKNFPVRLLSHKSFLIRDVMSENRRNFHLL